MKVFRLIIIAIILFISACSKDDKQPTEQNPPEEVDFIVDAQAFLETNSAALDPNDISTFSAIPSSSIEGAKIILTGENHGVAANTAIKFAMVKYLYENYGVKNIICEIGYSMSKYFQKYLDTGDLEILNFVFDNLEGSLYYAREQYEYWQSLYEFNATLPEGQKLKLFGLDVEHQYIVALTYLGNLLPQTEPPASISSLINELKSFVDNNIYDDDQINSYAHNQLLDLTSNYDAYLNYLGQENVADFELTTRGIDALFTWRDNYGDDFVAQYNFRDEFMYNTFNILTFSENGKFFGQVGINHAVASSTDGVNWFATRLQSNANYRDKVLSILYFYQNCRALFYITGDYAETNLNTVGGGLQFVNGIDQGAFTLFNLVGENSPFSDPSYIQYYNPGGVYPTPFTEEMTNYFQEAILIKYSGAMQPYN